MELVILGSGEISQGTVVSRLNQRGLGDLEKTKAEGSIVKLGFKYGTYV